MLTTNPTPNAQIGAELTEMPQVLRNLQHAVAQCRDGVFITDAAGIISRVNPAFERLTGYSSLDAIGKDLSALTADGPHSEDYRHIWDRVLQQRHFSGRIGLKRRSGERLSVEITVTPVRDSRGRIANLVCTCSAGESQTLQTDSAEERAAAKPNQIKEVAHTLNGMLASVMAQAELSFEGLSREHPVRVHLKGIREGCRRAADLVRLRFELEQGELAPAPEPIHYQVSTSNETVGKPGESVKAKARAAVAG